MSRAIVIGGSIAGLCSARVLADFFDEVILLDRDQFPAEVAPRSGVPQARHVHALLRRGLKELEGLFPGFTAALLAAGAVAMDNGSDMALIRSWGWQDVAPLGSTSLCASRDLIEWTVRSLLRRQTGVQIVAGSSVAGLCASAESQLRVAGVRVRQADGSSQEIRAELVVDATGRSSRVENWLNDLEIQAPRTQCVDATAGYASRWYQPPPAAQRPAHWWWTALWIDAQPDLPRGAVLFPTEGDRWVVTAAGINGQYPPTDEAGFMHFLGTLGSPAILHTLARCQPISPIFGNRSTANVYRRYEDWGRELPGFIATGDSVCAFNPIYGQGMTCAAVCASILRSVLRSPWPRQGFERRFFRRQARFLDGVWALSTSADFMWPDTLGERPNVPRFVTRYTDLALESAHHDASLLRHVIPIYDLSGSAARYFEPRFAAKVMLAVCKRRLSQRLFGSQAIPDLPPVPEGFDPNRQRPSFASLRPGYAAETSGADGAKPLPSRATKAAKRSPVRSSTG
jgi:2-polyprenyl-6-methoxyphenol hydroxylase-like FAD-dependent oxidoreductase